MINCNLQRLDGPVRGNGKIIQELERVFKGAGWNVIKVVWGSKWDRLLRADTSGRLVELMTECVDGDYQTFKSRDGKYVREAFFGRYPETAALVADMSDDEIWALQRGGHDSIKVYAAYKRAVEHRGQPTVVLAKTIKGYGMGVAGEARNIAHQAKKMEVEAMRAFRDRFEIPVSDADIEKIPFYKPPDDSSEMRYLRDRVKALGQVPQRRRKSAALAVPELPAFDPQLKGTGDREISTTMSFVRILNTLVRDPAIGPRVVPIVADESRTFGMEGMFRQFGIYSSVGQLYHPQDAEQLMWYREDKLGQILQEGINEAGAFFVVDRRGHVVFEPRSADDSVLHLLLDVRISTDRRLGVGGGRQPHARFLARRAPPAARRSTAKVLQHEDGSSQVAASFIPNCRSYDPTFGYEVATIIQDGVRRMLDRSGRRLLLHHAAQRELSAPGHARRAFATAFCAACTCCATAAIAAKNEPRVQLFGSGAILREVLAAAELLENEWNVCSDVWSVTSFNQLQRDGVAARRWNLLHPDGPPRRSFVEESLNGRVGPGIAATDYIHTFAEQIRPFVGRQYVTLGTDGYGRSDYRRKLREFFEVNRHFVTLAAFKALADEGTIAPAIAAKALKKYAHRSR